MKIIWKNQKKYILSLDIERGDLYTGISDLSTGQLLGRLVKSNAKLSRITQGCE